MNDVAPVDPEAAAANQRIEDIASGEPRSSLPVEMTGDRSSEYEWADQIKSAWQKSVEGIIECGRLLIEAKAALLHGTFEAMVEAELPFSLRTAERLMEIAGDARLTNPTHVSLLPPHWGTLHALTQLQDDVFQAKLKDGTIHPEMTRKDAAPLREKKRPDRPRQFINLIDRCWEVVDNLDDVPDDVKVALEHLESYKRKLQAEIDWRKAEHSAARKRAGVRPEGGRQGSSGQAGSCANKSATEKPHKAPDQTDPDAASTSNTAAHLDDGFDIPPFLDRRAKPKSELAS
jgi:hypothetical protein